jgi:transcriptional regulator with XRE-family HTH domain
MSGRHKWEDTRAKSKLTPEQLEENTRAAEAIVARMKLDELRRARHLSQAQLAEALETDQGAISRMERRTDLYVSTLRRFIEAAGGELCITARFPDGDPVELEGFGDIEPPVYAPRKARKSVASDKSTTQHPRKKAKKAA